MVRGAAASTAAAGAKYFHADIQGSITAVSEAGGTVHSTYAYGPYGEPSRITGSRFRYTGQITLPGVGLNYYKARMYSPLLGRFLQTDPIGTSGGMNVYGYVGGDPVNATDTWGFGPVPTESIVVTAPIHREDVTSFPRLPGVTTIICNGGCEFTSGFNGTPGDYEPSNPGEVIVVAKEKIISVSKPSGGGGGGIIGGGGGGDGNRPQPRNKGAECSQDVLNAMNIIADFGDSFDQFGNVTLGAAGAVAIAGALTASTGIGAPVGGVEEIGAGAIAAFGLSMKAFGGSLKTFATGVNAIETGNRNIMGAVILSGIASAIPSGGGLAADILHDALGSQAGSLVGADGRIRKCPV